MDEDDGEEEKKVGTSRHSRERLREIRYMCFCGKESITLLQLPNQLLPLELKQAPIQVPY